MKVVFLTACTSRSAGGLYFTITEYTKALKSLGVDVVVIGFNDQFSNKDMANYGDVQVEIYDRVNFPILKTFGYSLNIIKVLEQLSPDIIHLQGLWMYHSWAAKKYLNRYPKTKLVIEPHGMLDPWAVNNSKWKKKIVGQLFENWNLKHSDCLHALCESEKESIRNYGLNNRVEIIPNGITMPQPFPGEASYNKVLLYLGRIHPKKGLNFMIEALAKYVKYNGNLNGWHVRIAGWNQDNFQQTLERMVNEYSLQNYVQFIGPKFGDEKILELRNASAFILPSLSEGLPMSVLEAWSFGLPVLMTPFCNLPDGFSEGVAIQIEPTSESVYSGLSMLFSLGEHDIKHMGKKAREYASHNYTWASIAERTVALYNDLLKQ